MALQKLQGQKPQKKAQQPIPATRRRRNEKPFVENNQWQARDAAPFIAIPAWWRGFIFRVLDPIDIAVYTYMCSRMGKIPVSFPELSQIRGAVNRTDNPVRASLARIVRCGFLLEDKKATTRSESDVYARYQRPRALHTIKTLLEQGKIDDNLIYLLPSERDTVHIHNGSTIDAVDFIEPVARLGLKNGMGPSLFAAYTYLRTGLLNERKSIQIASLKAVIEARLESLESNNAGESVLLAKSKLRALGIVPEQALRRFSNARISTSRPSAKNSGPVPAIS